MTKSNVEIKKIIEADDKLYQKFIDANVHIESFLESKDKKEFNFDEKGKPFDFVKAVEDAVKKAESKIKEKDDEEDG